MLMRIVPVAFLFLVSIALLASQSVDDSSHKLLLEQINSLRSNLLHTSEANDASQWLILGHAIQAYDLRYHSGGNKMKNEALKAYDEALRLNNDKNLDMTFQINNFKGLIYKSMRKGIEALQCYDISLNLSEIPNRIAYVLSAKADIHKMLGNITTAIAMYKEAIGISSTNSLESFLSLAKCYKEIKADRALSIELLNDIEMMIKKFDDEDMIIPSTGILWAAFEITDHIGDVDKAWLYLNRAHEMELIRRQPYNPSIFDDQIENIQSIFHKSFWPPGVGVQTTVPIFIVGMMRSGSTLLETMLDAHPNIWGMGEDSTFNANLSHFRDQLVAASSSTDIPTSVSDIINDYGTAVIKDMIQLSSNENKTIFHIVDKMLTNYRNIGFIHLLFPRALIINMIRDPLDTLFGCFRQKFDEPGLVWTFHMDHLIQQYTLYLEIMQHYREVLPGRVLDIRYEKLVENPEKILREIFQRLQLPWDPVVLDFYKTNRTVLTNSQTQVRHKISTEYIGAWRKYAKQLKPFIMLFRQQIPRLRLKNALPYWDEMNWNMDIDFPYPTPHPRSLTSNGTEKSSAIVEATKEVSSDQKDISLPSSQAFERTEEDHNSVISYAVNGDGYYRTITVQFKDARPQLTNEFIYEYGRSCPKYQCGDHSSCRKASSLTPTTTVSTPSVVQATVEVNEEQIDATASNEVSESHHDQKKIKKEFKGSPSNTAYESFMKERQNTVDELYERAQFSVKFPHLSPSLVATFLANFNYLDNDDEIYEIIGTGYYLVNSGDLSTAVTIFNTLIAAFYTDDEHLLTDKRFERFEADYPLITSYKMMKEHEKKKMVSYRKKDKGVLVKSLDGLANALAMLGYYDISIKVDNDLLKLIPDDHITILKRRGQVYSVLERHEEAIRDFTVIIDKLQESEALQSIIDRGKNYYSLHLPVAAYKDFSKAVSILRQSPDLITDSKVLSELWFRIGKCLKDFNDIPETIESYEKSLQYDSSNSQTYLELAGAALELSQWEKALDYIANLLKQDSKNTNAFGLRSLILYSLGMISRAYSDVKKGASLGMNDKFALQYAAYINLGFGNFKTAVDFYDKLLHSTPSSKIEAMREVAIFSFLYKDTPLREYSMDVEIDTIIRDATMKDSQESLELSDSYETDADDIYDMNLDRRVLKNLRDRLRQEKAFEAVRVTYAIADWMQIDSPGFLINYRQHVMFGLSVLQMAQTLLLHINIIKRGGIGLIVPDKASSKLKYYGMKHCAALDCQAKHHVFGWRDLLDIYVKWRQISEPKDNVWWVDLLSRMGSVVGLSTHMMKGPNKVIRYYSYFDMAFYLTKDMMAKHGYYSMMNQLSQSTQAQRKQIKAATSLDDLYQITKANFYIQVPCSIRDDRIVDGTRLYIEKRPEGYDFSIAIGVTLERYFKYEEEMDHLFHRIVNGFVQNEFKTDDQIKDMSLKLFYLWVNYAVLTRGTAAGGYALLYALLLVHGNMITKQLPTGIQLDWEAILRTRSTEFINDVRSFVQINSSVPLSLQRYLMWNLTDNLNGKGLREEDIEDFSDVDCKLISCIFQSLSDILPVLIDP